jgi:hypothetical protein
MYEIKREQFKKKMQATYWDEENLCYDFINKTPNLFVSKDILIKKLRTFLGLNDVYFTVAKSV